MWLRKRERQGAGDWVLDMLGVFILVSDLLMGVARVKIGR
jgi:hypothetical protein